MRKCMVLGSVVLPLFVVGCTVAPQPVTEAELKTIVREDAAAIAEVVAPVTGPVGLEEAVARALKHNLDYRTRLLEQSLAAGQLEAGRFDILPQLVASAGYSWQNEENIRNSVDSVTGQPTETNPTISTDRTTPTAGIGLSWSILDFGVSYFNSKQNADRLLVANERRRKAMHNLMQSVRTTYWRALAAQQLRDQVRVTIDEAEKALADSRAVLNSQVRNPAEPLRYQRNLLENLRLLENVDRELAASELDLATLIGARPGERIQLVEPPAATLKPLDAPIADLEEMALLNNADLREEVYNARIAATETRKALVKLLPNLSLDAGYKYDGDRYLINQTWAEAATQVTFNLFNLVSGPARIRAAEMDETVAESRRMAVQMAVLSQLHMARYLYDDALRQYDRAVAIQDVDTRLADLARSQERSQMGGGLERISANVTAILSTVRRYHALARVSEAESRVQASLGRDPVIESVDTMTLEDLTAKVAAAFRAWS